MKYSIIITLLLFLFNPTFGQDAQKCKVKLANLQGEYRGGCKKGLASGQGSAKGKHIYTGEFKKGYPDGEGKYIWSGDDYYEGSFKKGKRNGFGKHYMIVDGKSSFIEGYWRNDAYIGKQLKRQECITITKTGIDRVIYKYRGDLPVKNVINILFKRGGRTIRTDINIQSCIGSSGEFISLNDYHFEYMDFPFTANLTFSAPGKMLTMSMLGSLKFKIVEPGSWDVIIYI